MAKGNMFLGQAKGKVGSIVFSRALGKQISRTKPSSVKNPKTRAQNAQRAILATVAKAASIMTPIVDHSFAGVAYGAESVRHFRKINLNQLRALYMDGDPTGYNLTPKGGAVVPNSYIVSQGNLPAFMIAYAGDDFGFKMTDLAIASNGSVANFKVAYPYIQGGDQITLVQLVLTSGSLETGDAKFAFLYDRIVFAPNAFDDDNSTIINEDGYFVESKLDLTKTTNPTMLEVREVGKKRMLASTTSTKVYAAALIISREVNGVWQRSTQEMGLTHEQDVQNIEDAINSYSATASEIEDTEYLNQADDSDNDNGHSGVSDAYMQISHKVSDGDIQIAQVNAGEKATITIQGASGAMVSLSAQAFVPTGKRIVTVELDRPDGSVAAHQAKTLNYNVAITAQTAGVWPLTAVFNDGTRAICNIKLAIQA